jgi:hypothetical protein
VPDVDVAAGVFRVWIPAILWKDALKIQGTVVEAMTVGVTGGEIQNERLLVKVCRTLRL